MKREVRMFCIAAVAAVVLASVPAFAADAALKFKDVIQKLESLRGKYGAAGQDTDRYSGSTGEERVDLQRKYYDDVKGRTVEGEGAVIKIAMSRRDRVAVSILTQDSHPTKGFNVIVHARREELGSLKEGDKASFRGTIERMSLLRGLSLDIEGTLDKAGGKKK